MNGKIGLAGLPYFILTTKNVGECKYRGLEVVCLYYFWIVSVRAE